MIDKERHAMRLPRVRLSVRRLLALIAVVAVGLFLYREFDEGVPPRFIVRAIPGRIARLRPGMTRDEAHAILGLHRSWLRGGINTSGGITRGGAHRIHASYHVREPRTVVLNTQSGPQSYSISKGIIQLRFHDGPGPNYRIRRQSAQLEAASFSWDGRIIAEMPNPARVRKDSKEPGR